MKTLAKTLIVVGLAIVLGWLLVSYTSRGQERYASLKHNARVGLLQLLDADPKIISSNDTQTQDNSIISDKQNEFDRESSNNPDEDGVIVSSGSLDNSSDLEAAMQHYKNSKDELWSGKNLPL